jgi:tetratricopeptide (TPR) repeat protein
MKKAILLLAIVPLFFTASSQSTYYVDSLKRQLAHAITVPDKMYWLNAQATYYIGFDNSRAEELGSRMLAIADSSRNREWMIKACLYSADRYYEFGYVQQSINKGLAYSQKAFDIAKASHSDEYACWAYLAMARGYRSNGELDKAINSINMALSVASSIDNDSLKTYIYNSLAKTYLVKNEKLLAFRSCLNALDIAERNGEYTLLQKSYDQMSDIYRSLSDFEKAKDFQFKRAALQQQQHQLYDLLDTYQAIGALYNYQNEYDLSLSYFQKAITLSDSLHLEIYKVQIYNSIINLYIHNEMYEQCVVYFNTHTEVKDFLNRAEMSYFTDYIYGVLYLYSNKLDSAIYYLKKSGPYILTRANKLNQYQFYFMMATYYRKINDYDKAIEYMLKGKVQGEQLASLTILQETATNLDSLYQDKGDYKNAYVYNTLYHTYTDSLNTLAKERDMMSLEIDNENRRKERDAKLQEEKIRRNHDLQYMAITVAITGIFILLGVAGVFKVSKAYISTLSFFAFIFLFEFIILIADNKIHHLTHGEPWKVLAIKIGLIAILSPLHHKLEEKVIHYLTTKQLVRIKGRRLLGRWFKKKDVDVPMSNM